ncbi:MAG: mismatch repair protein MutL [Candidatus Hydrogenedentes bacterium]|nr:mismatch repair protein MutL [Candidatus Hydrogenedentota bacterium]
MNDKIKIAPVRVLPENLANKIAAGEVVERPASVVKELVENALDAGATRIVVRMVAAGRTTIEVIDDGHGMSQQNALLAIERHATSKIRKDEDLDNIRTLGFRGEALPSIGAVSRMEIVTRRAEDDAATQIRLEGGILRDVSETAGPVGTRVTVNRLYFNTPVRAKFLKGITTELGHCIDVVQRHALACEGVGFQFVHNEKALLDVPSNAPLRERVALIWGMNFASEMVDFDGQQAGFRVRGIIGTPNLSRSGRSHQFFFLNSRPIVNRSVQYGFEDGYRGLLTVGRHPVGVVLIETHPRLVDVNIHPTKRDVRFRDERAVHDAIRDVVRNRLESLRTGAPAPMVQEEETPSTPREETPRPKAAAASRPSERPKPAPPARPSKAKAKPALVEPSPGVQTQLPGTASYRDPDADDESPTGMFEPVDNLPDAPMQIFDTYLLVPEEGRLLIIDQHALHERLSYDNLRAELSETDHAMQQLAVPLLVDVAPSQVRLLESNIGLFTSLGIQIEPFGGNTFQVTAVCHVYEESRVPDAIYRVLDELAQGDLFDKDDFVSDFLRLTIAACRGSVKAGDQLSPEERRGLLQGFRRLRPPYTCPHGRPIITELTQSQMEKSFRRRQ